MSLAGQRKIPRRENENYLRVVSKKTALLHKKYTGCEVNVCSYRSNHTLSLTYAHLLQNFLVLLISLAAGQLLQEERDFLCDRFCPSTASQIRVVVDHQASPNCLLNFKEFWDFLETRTTEHASYWVGFKKKTKTTGWVKRGLKWNWDPKHDQEWFY